MQRFSLFGAGVLVLLLAMGGAASAQGRSFDKWDLSVAVHDAATVLAPSVVSVETRFDKPRTSDDYLLWDYFRGARPTYGLYGSGIVYKGRYILTCDKVTDNMEYGRVVLSDGKAYPAKLLDTNGTYHVAVLELDVPAHVELPSPHFLDSDTLKLGMPIAVIGRSVNAIDTFATEGIISAIRKETLGSEIPTEEFIQFDANFELSFIGGALSDVNGNVAGMVYWTAGVNLNLAVPINDVLRAADKIIAGDKRVPWFGADLIVRTENIDIINGFDRTPYKFSFLDGLFVTYIEANSPADLAGLKVGDVIETIEGKRFEYLNEYKMMRRRWDIGQQVRIVFWRKGAGKLDRQEIVLTILPTPDTADTGTKETALPPGHPPLY